MEKKDSKVLDCPYGTAVKTARGVGRLRSAIRGISDDLTLGMTARSIAMNIDLTLREAQNDLRNLINELKAK